MLQATASAALSEHAERILVAACDLDKTVYPPAGPNHDKQLAANVASMFRFESVGGFVFPVTGDVAKLPSCSQPARFANHVAIALYPHRRQQPTAGSSQISCGRWDTT